MSTGFPSVTMPPTPVPRTPSGYQNAASPGMDSGKDGALLNASRVKLNVDYLSGLQDGQPAISGEVHLPKTGVQRLDWMLSKTGDAGVYAFQGTSMLLADTCRGAVAGALGGGALGLLAGGLTKLARQSWPLKATLPIGLLIGGILGSWGGGLTAFARSSAVLAHHVRRTLKQEYEALKADPASILPTWNREE